MTNSDQRWSRIHWAAVVGAMAVLGLLLALLVNTAVDAKNDSEENANRLGTAQGQIDALADQVKRLGGKPVVKPSEVPEPVTGPTGPPPSPEMVEQAVRQYCAENDCVGQRGPRGRSGESVSAADVAAAVALYCNARGDCSGPRGDSGPVGPGPTTDQIAQAVADYCAARDQCTGPAGPPGQNGQDGTDGKDGQSAFPFTFSFTISAGIPPAEGDRTFVCVVTSPDETAICQEQ